MIQRDLRSRNFTKSVRLVDGKFGFIVKASTALRKGRKVGQRLVLECKLAICVGYPRIRRPPLD